MEQSTISAKQRNQKVRAQLELQDQQTPGYLDHAQRVAVYAVSVGDRLGLEADALVALRFTAELHGISPLSAEFADLVASDERSRTIVNLCERFDALRTGYLSEPSASDDACVRWLKERAVHEFDPAIVEALLAIQSVIQPIGT